MISNSPPFFHVVCGILTNSRGEWMLARRAAHKSHAGQWEFPGGKIEKNESPCDALERELKEELQVEVTIGEKAGEVLHHYTNFTIHLIAFWCDGATAVLPGSDHDKIKWLDPSDIVVTELTEADQRLLQVVNPNRQANP